MTPLEALLGRDRAIVLGALGSVLVVSWAYLLAGAGTGMPSWEMSSLDSALGRMTTTASGEVTPGGMTLVETIGGGRRMGGVVCEAMATPASWSLGYAAVVLSMWWVMMVAMMVPSAAPTILLYSAVARRRREAGDDTLLPTGLFAGGYVAAWGFFSVVATVLQWTFEAAGILSPMTMNSTSVLFSAAILVAAGLYQWTSAKQACLRQCRGPLAFLMSHWRPGPWGALRMGATNGAYCLGCCWALMTLLFFGGVMNLYWIAGLAVIVLLEKTITTGDTLARVSGGLLILWGGTFVHQAMA